MSKKKKAKNKLVGSLMGFYEAMASVYLGSHQLDNKPDIAGLLIRFHLIELIAFHKDYTTKEDIPVPKPTDEYNDYIIKWNERIVSKEPIMTKMIEEFTKPKKLADIPYIS